MIGLVAITVFICLFRKSAIRASRFERIRFTIIYESLCGVLHKIEA